MMQATDATVREFYSALGDDPDLGVLVVMFVDEMPERIAKLQSAWQAQDLESLQRLAHQLKGAAGSYGFQPLTPFAATLEHAIADGAPRPEVDGHLQRLISMLQKARAGTPDR